MTSIKERVKKAILEALVFTNESSELWADSVAEVILVILDEATEPEAVEWEYGLRKPLDAVPRLTGSESLIQGYQDIHGGEIYRRIAPGPWLSVEGEKK